MQSKELSEYLEDLAGKTAAGIIIWERVNATVYKWGQSVGNEYYLTTIQKASIPVGTGNIKRTVSSYLLQILVRGKSDALVTISSKERPDYKDALAAVFSSAEASTDLVAKSVLSKLLGE